MENDDPEVIKGKMKDGLCSQKSAGSLEKEEEEGE